MNIPNFFTATAIVYFSFPENCIAHGERTHPFTSPFVPSLFLAVCMYKYYIDSYKTCGRHALRIHICLHVINNTYYLPLVITSLSFDHARGHAHLIE